MRTISLSWLSPLRAQVSSFMSLRFQKTAMSQLLSLKNRYLQFKVNSSEEEPPRPPCTHTSQRNSSATGHINKSEGLKIQRSFLDSQAVRVLMVSKDLDALMEAEEQN